VCPFHLHSPCLQCVLQHVTLDADHFFPCRMYKSSPGRCHSFCMEKWRVVPCIGRESISGAEVPQSLTYVQECLMLFTSYLYHNAHKNYNWCRSQTQATDALEGVVLGLLESARSLPIGLGCSFFRGQIRYNGTPTVSAIRCCGSRSPQLEPAS
jgi:hypothetical protein